jgi:hypothetical protein
MEGMRADVHASMQASLCDPRSRRGPRDGRGWPPVYGILTLLRTRIRPNIHRGLTRTLSLGSADGRLLSLPPSSFPPLT